MFTEPTPTPEVNDAILREAWLKERQTGIGASDAAAVFGLSPYKSALALYFEKRGEVDVPVAEREALYWGRILQSPIARRYRDETKRLIEEPNPYELRRHPTHPFMVATLDAIATPTPLGIEPPAGGFGVVEIKNAGFFKRDDWRDDEPPLAFQIQAQHQMAVTGAQWASIAALVGGVEFFWTDIPRHNGFIEKLMNTVGAFWERVKAGTPPEPDGTESTKQLLRELYPRDTGEVVALPVEYLTIDEQLQAIKATQKKLEIDRNTLEAKLKLGIGAATAATLDNGAVYTYKTQSRREYTVAAVEFRVLRRKGE